MKLPDFDNRFVRELPGDLLDGPGTRHVTGAAYSLVAPTPVSFDDMQRDLELLAAIGASDQRSLRAVALSRQLQKMDHYQILDVPRAATRAQILNQADEQKK